MFPHVFHIHNRIIHQRADSDSHTSEAHRVNAQAHIVEHEHRHHQRERKRDERNERSAHIGKEEKEDDNHEYRAFEERILHVADGVFDEARLAEGIGRDTHIGRQVLLQVVQRRL